MALDFKEYIKQLDLNYKAFLNTISVITKEYQNNYKIEEYEVEENTILQVLDLYETKFWKIINTLQGLISIDDSNDVSMLDNIISTNENNYMTVKTFLKRSLDNKKMYIMTSSKLDEIEIFIKKMNVFEGNFNIMQEKLVQYDKQSKTVINGNDLNVLYGSSVMRIWDDSAKVIFPNINTSELQEANYLGKKYLDTCKIKNKHSYKSGNINDLYFLREKKGCLDIEVKKMSKSQLFTELVKQIDNINTLSFKEINDEINNITKLVNSNVNGYYIDFEHNFEKINNFINEMYLIIKGIN